MAKFYIQSGNVSYVVAAQDVEGAALWAMHQTIEGRVDDQLFDSDFADDPDFLYFDSVLDGLAQFDRTIRCSQRGFGRDDAGELDTDTVFRHWDQLRKAADHLFDRLN